MQRPRFDARWARCIAAACGLLVLLGRTGWAASLSPQDIRVLGNALAFMQPRPARDGSVAVVYAGRNSPSHQDAEAILAMIGKGLTVGSVVLTPRLIDTADLQTSEFSLVIVAAGANGEAVMHSAQAHHSLCVTADQAAVQQGLCTMAIRSTGRVEILLNHQAAQASGVGFATAFRMMVREL
jgi:hypothetical protein